MKFSKHFDFQIMYFMKQSYILLVELGLFE